MRLSTDPQRDLVLTADRSERSMLRQARSYDDRLSIVSILIRSKGFRLVGPEKTALLPGTPIIAETDGKIKAGTRMWCFPHYPVVDPWKRLATEGEVVFDRVRSNEEPQSTLRKSIWIAFVCVVGVIMYGTMAAMIYLWVLLFW